MSPRTHEPTTLDDALAGWDPSTGIDAEVTRAQTRRAAEYLATTGDPLGRTDLVDALADGSTLDARTWWDHAAGPGIDRLAAVGIVDAGPDGFRWIGGDAVDAGGSDT